MKKYLGTFSQTIDEQTLINTLQELQREYKHTPFVPKTKWVLKAFRDCPYKELKVIFIGDSPLEELPFLNTYLAQAIDKYLNSWTVKPVLWQEQGVLMINRVLTKGKCIEKHKNIWYKFLTEFLENLSNKNNGLIYILLGKDASELKTSINTRINHVWEFDYNPSINYFEEINKILKYYNNTKIKWNE